MSGGALRVSGQDVAVSTLEQSQELQTPDGEFVPPKTVFDTLWHITSWYGERPCLGTRTRDATGALGSYSWLSYAEVWQRASHLGAGLLKSGLVGPGQFMGICCTNRPEWVIAEWCAVQYDFKAVPIVVTVLDDALAFMINQTEMRCVVTTSDLVPMFERVRPQCPTLRGLVVIDAPTPAPLSWAAMLEVGRDNFPGEYAGAARHDGDLWSLIYTSGSTGMPKGAMMSDGRWNRFVTAGYLMPSPIRLLSFAPLGHVSERQLMWIVFFYGGMYGFYSGSMDLLFDDMRALNPTYVSAPPRIYNAVYAQYKEAVDAHVLAHGEESRWRAELEQLDQFRGVFGNAIQFLVTGSAPTSDAVKRFMRQCWAVPVYDGYGTTECGGIATDGVIAPDVDVLLVDVPELGYLSTDNPPRGEICVKTKYMIDGYYKNPAKTAEAFVNGFFRTGDIGVRQGNSVTIIDRVKNVFKLAQGEFVAPAHAEGVLEKSPLLEQICVCAAPTHEFVVAVVVPCHDVCARLLGVELSTPLEQLVRVHGIDIELALLADFARLARRDGLQGFEVPARVVLSGERFTPENDQLTPSFKLKREPILRHFAAEIARVSQSRLPTAASSQHADILQRLAILLDQPLDAAHSTLALNGTDSLSAVKLVAQIRRAFGTDVPLSFVLSDPTAHELSDFIARGGGSAPDPRMPLVALDDLRTLTKRTALAQIEPLEPFARAQTVLVTGATGFLGCFVVRELLDRLAPSSTVVCLVRGPDAARRLQKSCAQRGVNMDGWDRVRVVEANLEHHPGWGLDPAIHADLCISVDAVVHCAAVVNWTLPYTALRSANVLCCADLAEFCQTGKRKRLVHVSTITCCPVRAASTAVRGSSAMAQQAGAWETFEGYADLEWAHRLGPYGQSKWLAEEVLRARMDPSALCIVRPANIMAHSQSGASNLTDFMDRYVSTALAMGVAIGDTEAVFNFTPVDWIARAIVRVATSTPPESVGIPATLSNNASPTYAQLARVLRDQAGYTALQVVSYADFRARLLSHPARESLALFGLIPMFVESAQWIYGMPVADARIAEATVGEQCPPTTDAALAQWIAFLQAQAFIQAPCK